LLDPASAFDQPQDVVNDRRLANDAKIKLLRQWEADARQLAVAEEEGMTGGEESMLNRVRRALRALGAAEQAEHGPTTKLG
jgi:hypothetical protein